MEMRKEKRTTLSLRMITLLTTIPHMNEKRRNFFVVFLMKRKEEKEGGVTGGEMRNAYRSNQQTALEPLP